MSECEEHARDMLGDYLSWLEYTDSPNDFRSARDYVRMKMPNETITVQDNVAESLVNN